MKRSAGKAPLPVVKPAGHALRSHSDFAPSSARRWLNCPGSVRLARKVPRPPPGPAAEEGTRAHECLEFLVKRYGNIVAATAAAAQRWPADMVEHCVGAAHQVFELQPSPSAKLMTEQRVKLTVAGTALSGTLDDAWVEDWGALVVIDFKYGAGEKIECRDEAGSLNEQLMLYALGVAEQHEYAFTSIAIAVIQPRTWSADGSGLIIENVTHDDMAAYRARVERGIAAAAAPAAELKVGDWCKWCPVLPTCPQATAQAFAAADMVFDVEQGLLAAPEPLALKGAALARALEACDALDRWTSAVRSYAYQMADRGEAPDGWQLVPKRASRTWLPGADKIAATRFGDVAFETEQRFLSPAQLEKTLGAEGKAFAAEYALAVSSGSKLQRIKDGGTPVAPVDFDFEATPAARSAAREDYMEPLRGRRRQYDDETVFDV